MTQRCSGPEAIECFFCLLLWVPPVHLLCGVLECSLALSGTSISSGAPCGRANSACPTSGTSWSTDISVTLFFPTPCMFRPFGSHHEVHLHPFPSRRGNIHALSENDRAIGEGLQLTIEGKFLSTQPLLKYLSAQPLIPSSITHLPWMHH